MKIGPRQQRFEVLPVPAWNLADLFDERRTEAPRDPLDIATSGIDRDLESAGSDDR